MRKVMMIVGIPDEEWEAFREEEEKSGCVRFKFRNSMIYAVEMSDDGE